MKNQSINLENIFSVIGFFSLFLIFSGSELKADPLISSENTNTASKKIKWEKYERSTKNKKIKKVLKDPKEINSKLITELKNEEKLEDKEDVTIKKVSQKSNL